MAVPDLGRIHVGSLLFLLVPSALFLVGVHAGTNDQKNHAKPVVDGFWKTGKPVAIAVRDGRATFRVPASSSGSETAVIVSSLSRAPGPFTITLKARPAGEPAIPEQALESPPRRPKLAAFRAEDVVSSATTQPASSREFHLMVRDGDVTSKTNYLAVKGILRSVGKHVAIYVAAEDVGAVDDAVLKDVISTFDDQIFPGTSRLFGLAHDIDGDERFTVLFSSWLKRLGNGRHAVDGFVRVTDLDPLYSPPFGNRCDMMYLSTALKSGPHLRTVMAHEYMHAVAFSRKSLHVSGTGLILVEEEGWLDEALAHLAEDLHGFSRSNIDYRVSAFLAQPERYQLVVEDYYAADLFRSHGHRGSTYLFLRWCVDHYGQELLPSLIESRLRGIANLEDATGCRFAELYRRWSLDLFRSSLDLASSVGSTDSQSDLPMNKKPKINDKEAMGPRTVRVVSGGPAWRWSAVGTSSQFVVVHSTAPGAAEVTVAGPATAELQVTVLPLPADLSRLELTARTTTGPDGELRLRASIREQGGGPVQLSTLGWEPLTPPPDPHALGERNGQLDSPGILASFGSTHVPSGGTLNSRPIRLPGVHPESGTFIVRLMGTDAAGRRVVAWTEINNEPPLR
jgi:hypothetical protein